MNDILKKHIGRLVEICNTSISSDDSRSFSDVEIELLNFASYLSASDGVIRKEEAAFLEQYLQRDCSVQELSRYIQEKNTYSTEFESTQPKILQRLIAEDNQHYENGGNLSFSNSLTYIQVFEEFGKEFIGCDGNADAREVDDFNTYISMLKQCRRTLYKGNDTARSSLEKTADSGAGKSINEEPSGESEERGESLDELLDQLNSLVGLQSVKDDVTSLIHLQEIQRIRKERGLKQIPLSNHLVFYGNPGTGKTTVARLLAKIYHAIGILSKGTLVEVDRSGLVGGYVGQTAIKTKSVLDSALGGVLFIDEAYALAYSNSGNDYGREAIDTILKGMEDNREDLIVIAAGYPDLMQKFIDSNPGLRSRFNKYIRFPDYTPDELIDIFKMLCDKSGYKISDEALKLVSETLNKRYVNRGENFANGREVRNIFEVIISNQANRLFGRENISNEELCEIIPNDVCI